MGSKQATSTATNTSEPWQDQKPYLQQGFSEAQKIYQGADPKFFPGSTVAGFSPEQQQAQTLATQRATGGNQTMDAAENWTQKAIGGQFSQDPYQSQVFQNIQSKVMPSVNAQFSSAGRYGSGAHADTATRALTESFAPYASQMYQQGVDRQQSAAGMAPTFAQNDYADIAALQDVGQQKQLLGQSEIDDARARFDYAQDLPYNKLSQYQAAIGGNWGGQQTSATPYYKPSLASQLTGGALSLAGLFG